MTRTLQRGCSRAITCDTNGTITSLVLTNQRLRGSVTSLIGLLSSLTSLWLGSNQMQSSVPSELGLLSYHAPVRRAWRR
jgi:hypothetical protein